MRAGRLETSHRTREWPTRANRAAPQPKTCARHFACIDIEPRDTRPDSFEAGLRRIFIEDRE
jgi:hypothetical protein